MKPKHKKVGGTIWIAPKGPSMALRGLHSDGRKNTLRKVNGLVWKPAVYKQRHLAETQENWFLTEANAANFLRDKLYELRLDKTYKSKGYCQFALFGQFGNSEPREERLKGTSLIVTRRRSLGPKILGPVLVLCDDGKWHLWKKGDFWLARRRKRTSNPGLQPLKP